MTSRSPERLSRRIFVVSLTLVVLGATFAFGAVAQREDLPPIPQLRAAGETLSNVRDNDVTNHPRRHHLQPSRDQGSGVTVDEVDDGALVLMAGFFDEENQVRLVERDGTVVKRWSLDYFEDFPDPTTRPCVFETPLRVDTHGVHLTPEGDLLVNYEYCGTVRFDACGELVWRLGERTHHSIEPAAEGGHWIVGRQEWLAQDHPDRYPPIFHPGPKQLVQEDTILRVDDDGEVVEEVSIPQLMRDNGMEALLSADGLKMDIRTEEPWELVHANKVAELSADVADAYPMFEAGDLALSLRGLNLVMVVDPDDWQVRWHQIGPWLRQHDPEFRPDGRLSIFNNNIYYHQAYEDDQTILSAPRTTNVVAVDPATGDTEVVFGESPGQEMLSVVRGEHELLDDGGMLITEFDGGRVLQVDADGQVVWEYVNAYDDEHVAEITNAALVDPSANGTDPSC